MQDNMCVSCRLDALYAGLSSHLHAGRYVQTSDRLQIPEASVKREAAQAFRWHIVCPEKWPSLLAGGIYSGRLLMGQGW